MRVASLKSVLLTAVSAPLLAGALGCDTGFGQPCSLPKSAEFRQACEPSPSTGGADAGPNDVKTEARASCAVDNFAGCETRVCLVYRGSNSFCSEPCEQNGDCEGSARCRPLIGDLGEADDPGALTPNPCVDNGDGFPPQCYCVRKGDVDN